MPSVVLWVALFTFVIHYLDTLSYSVRIAGVRTGHIALATSLFNILFLVSRSANVLQAPLLTNYVEKAIILNETTSLRSNFHFLIFIATLASLAAAVSIPTFHRLMAMVINKFKETGSVPRLILQFFSIKGMTGLTRATKLPSPASLKSICNISGIPFWPVCSNVLVTAFHTIGVLSAIYAGMLIPSYRATALTLSAVVNSMATIVYFIIVDPTVAFVTDQTLCGKTAQGRLRRLVLFLVSGKTAGTLLGQILFLPAATFISLVARFIAGIS